MEISFFNKWVAGGCNYDAGVAFYAIHGKNNTYKKLFALGANNFTTKELYEELSKLIKITVKDGAVKVRPKMSIDRDTLPPYLQIEYDKLGQLIGEISFHHSQLTNVMTEKERFKVAELIYNKGKERRSIFNRIDYYAETGKDLMKLHEIKKEVSPESDLKVLQLKEERRRLCVQRSKLKNKVHRDKDYNEVVNRMNDIDKELKGE